MNFIKRILCGLCLVFGVVVPNSAFAWGIFDIDSFLDISELIPIVLDAFMSVANGTYKYFVGPHHDGIIYLLVWGFFGFYVGLYLVKLYIPKFSLSIFGFQPWDSIDKTGGMQIAENVAKPAVRVLVAVILLSITPQTIAKTVINPVLGFGSMYTKVIIETSTDMQNVNNDRQIQCPRDLLEEGWLNQEACNYLMQPVHVLSRANNNVIKRGFKYLSNGLQTLTTLMVHNSGQGFMNIITGLLLVSTFVTCNVFMALLIIQAIFNFGMALILYPFSITAWVAKKSDRWFDIWPVFSGLIEALKQIVITMIACAFILCVNLALVRALFQWNNTSFVAAANGVVYSNVPNVGSYSNGFSGHSMLWLSCILTFFLFNKIFEITKEKLTGYVGKDATNLYEQVKGEAKTGWGIAKSAPGKIKDLWKVIKGK